MATQRDRILDYLRSHPAGADDDVLARELGLPQRQTANMICRRLEAQGILTRRPDRSTGKLVNVLTHSGANQAGTAPTPTPPSPPVTPAVTGRLIPLQTEAALRELCYPGELGLSEDTVKGAVKVALEADGWTVDVRWGHEHGLDIEALRGPERLALEAKGEGSLSAMRVNYFLGALGELLQRMNSAETSYGLALPAHRQFAGLIARLPILVITRLDLCFFLVRPGANGGYEVGLVYVLNGAG
jgi:hypothetical protein